MVNCAFSLSLEETHFSDFLVAHRRIFFHSIAMESHTWREKTEEGTMFYKANHHAGRWTLERTLKVGRSERDDAEWEPVEFTREYWVTLRDVLWRKYQRKRCPWRLIEKIDKLLEDEYPEEVEEDDEY